MWLIVTLYNIGILTSKQLNHSTCGRPAKLHARLPKALQWLFLCDATLEGRRSLVNNKSHQYASPFLLPQRYGYYRGYRGWTSQKNQTKEHANKTPDHRGWLGQDHVEHCNEVRMAHHLEVEQPLDWWTINRTQTTQQAHEAQEMRVESNTSQTRSCKASAVRWVVWTHPESLGL